jgi:hypothetical protein
MRFSSPAFGLALGLLANPSPAGAQQPPPPGTADFPLDDLAPQAPPTAAPSPNADRPEDRPPQNPPASAESRLPPPTTPTPAATESRPAPPRRQFGDANQLVFVQSIGASIENGGYSNSAASSFTVAIQPSFHYFVSSEISLGAHLTLQHAAHTIPVEIPPYGVVNIENKTTSYGGGVDLGANAPLSELVSVWIRLQLSFMSLHSTTTEPPQGLDSNPVTVIILGGGANGGLVHVGLYAPILIHPTEHFFLGIGPDLFFEKFSKASSWWSNLGLSSTIGGWI